MDFVENVLLYAPIGAALGLAGLSAWRGWLLGLVLSAVIETLQVDVIGLLSALWVSLLALPVGYWAARTTGPAAAREQRSVQRHIMALAFLALTFAVALAFVPAVTGSAAASAWQWLAAGVGAMLGGLLAHGVGRRRRAPHEART